jgi:hypothetical protein
MQRHPAFGRLFIRSVCFNSVDCHRFQKVCVMRYLLSIFLFFSFFVHSKSQISFADLTGQIDDDPADIQNRTYVEEQNALQRQIFTKYDRNTRPKRDQTQPTAVSVHLHLMHFSVQESKQSIRLFGHLYLVSYSSGNLT